MELESYSHFTLYTRINTFILRYSTLRIEMQQLLHVKVYILKGFF